MVVVMAVLPEKCFGHVQKRMGSTLTEYKKSMKGKKLSDGKGVGSAGRLTDDVVKKIQDYYSFAIQQNKGDMMGMVTTIKTRVYRDKLGSRGKMGNFAILETLCPWSSISVIIQYFHT